MHELKEKKMKGGPPGGGAYVRLIVFVTNTLVRSGTVEITSNKRNMGYMIYMS